VKVFCLLEGGAFLHKVRGRDTGTVLYAGEVLNPYILCLLSTLHRLPTGVAEGTESGNDIRGREGSRVFGCYIDPVKNILTYQDAKECKEAPYRKGDIAVEAKKCRPRFGEPKQERHLPLFEGNAKARPRLERQGPANALQCGSTGCGAHGLPVKTGNLRLAYLGKLRSEGCRQANAKVINPGLPPVESGVHPRSAIWYTP
ncbi:unnamed protein product, partial [Symbiodinium sp. CCMP2456]